MGTNEPPNLTYAGPLLRVTKLAKRYRRGGLWGNKISILAVDGVDLEIPFGETLALVGQSGSGKSTLARCVACLEKIDSGEISIAGQRISNPGSRRLEPLPNAVQMVFQDPVTSMNPRFSADQVLEEPLLLQGKEKQLRRRAVLESMDEVGLPSGAMDRLITEFSGGQRQRLAIARALLLRPKLLVLDEALTGLDLSTQAQIANLLLALQKRHLLTYLLISHDLTLVSRISTATAVMANGRIVENGPTPEIMSGPKHEETIRLLAPVRTAHAKFAALSGASA